MFCSFVGMTLLVFVGLGSFVFHLWVVSVVDSFSVVIVALSEVANALAALFTSFVGYSSSGCGFRGM